MKIKKLFMSISSVITAFSLLTAANVYSPMEASAWNNQLNIKVYMCQTMCANLSSICDSATLGTYGVPTGFTDRLPAITGYTYGYYMNCGAHLNFSDFSPANDLLNSPAAQCASNSSNYVNTITNGCYCYDNAQCLNVTQHHSSIYNYRDALPTFNSSNTAVICLTASALCNHSSNGHGSLLGVTWSNDMIIISRDSDYKETHEKDGNAYAYARKTLVHEIGHMYNVVDHYNENTSVLPAKDPNCIWGANKNDYDVLTICQTCDICHSTIYNNRNLYQHS